MKTPLISCVIFACASAALAAQIQSPTASSSADPANPTGQTGRTGQPSQTIQTTSNRDGLSAPCLPMGNTFANLTVSGIGLSTSSALTQAVRANEPWRDGYTEPQCARAARGSERVLKDGVYRVEFVAASDRIDRHAR